MNQMLDILNELNEENGSNYKINTLKKHKDNELLKRVLKMAYDKVQFTYGITMKNISYSIATDYPVGVLSLEYALAVLENSFCTREATGNQANELLSNVLSQMNHNDAVVIARILDRDLRINMGRSNINKVFKDLITKPVYQRCDIFTENSIDEKTKKLKKGTSNKIDYPAKLDLKADGTYREVAVDENGSVRYASRSGEEYDYPLLTEGFETLTSGRYFGELTVELTQELLDKIIVDLMKKDPDNAQEVVEAFANGVTTLPRAIGNGLINSDEVPHENIVMDIWQYVTEEEYVNAGNKILNTIEYYESFLKMEAEINTLNSKYLRVCEYVIVKNKQEALAQVSKWMNAGLEGGVLKNLSMKFRDGTNPEQLKMKLVIELEVRCTGFTAGKKGTKREATFGAMMFATDDGMIKGQTSGFPDAMLEDINNNREKYTDQIFSVQCNDITRGRGNEHYALSHPRFAEWRNDKDETDTLERAFELRLMAMGLKDEIN